MVATVLRTSVVLGLSGDILGTANSQVVGVLPTFVWTSSLALIASSRDVSAALRGGPSAWQLQT